MTVDLTPLAHAATAAAAGAVTALAGLLMARLPLIWTALRVSIDGSDATRLRFAIANASQTALRAIDGGQPQDRAVDDMVAYVRAAMPRAVARLGAADSTLVTMAEAELARAMVARS